MKQLVINVPDEIADLIENNRKEASKTHVANKFFERLLVIAIIQMFDKMTNQPEETLAEIQVWKNLINWED